MSEQLPPGFLERSIDLPEIEGPLSKVIEGLNTAVKLALEDWIEPQGFIIKQDAGYNTISTVLVFRSRMSALETEIEESSAGRMLGLKEERRLARYNTWVKLNREFSTANGD